MTTYTGTSSADTITGSSDSDLLSGLTGNDILSGGDGDDSLLGGDGNDTLSGGSGSDTLNGTSGSDVLSGGDGDDLFLVSGGTPVSIDGGTGTDTLLASGTLTGTVSTIEILQVNGSLTATASQLSGLSTLAPSDGTESFTLTLASSTTATALSLVDKVSGLASLVGSSGADVVTLGTGGSANGGYRVSMGAGNDTITTGDDDDSIHGGDGNDVLNGGGGADSLVGSYGNDTLNGGDGDDVLSDTSGSNVFNGGAGDDLFLIGSGCATTVVGGDGNDIIQMTGTLTASLSSVEELQATGALTLGSAQVSALTLITRAESNTSDSFSLTLTGGGAFDLRGKLQSVGTITGSTGNDTITVDASGTALSGYTMNGGDGNDTITADSTDDSLLGGAGNDSLVGGSGSDTLNGQTGTDVLQGGEGDDTLIDSIGGDSLLGGAGDDLFILSATTAGTAGVIAGGDGTDVIQASGVLNATLSSIEELRVQTSLTVSSPSSLSSVTTIGSASDTAGFTLTLSAASTLNLSNRVESLRTLLGSSGVDVLTLGDSGYDTNNRNGFVVYGNDGNDTITSGAGDDSLNGGAGNDTLSSSDGDDTFTGGAGSDRFILSAGFTGSNTITDFGSTDVLDVSGLGYTSLTQVKAAMATSGTGVVLTSSTGTVRLNNVSLSSLVTGNFIYVSGGAPQLVTALSDQTVEEGTAFSFTLPSGSFVSSSGSSLTYSAKLSNGSSLPSWLTFNASTRTFSGTAPTNASDYTLRITAATSNGQTVSDDFVLTTKSEPGSTTATASSLGTLSTTVSSPLSYSNKITSSDTVDMLKFVVSSASSVAIYMSGLSADADFSLLSSSGSVLTTSTSNGSTADLVTRSLSAGTYYLKVFAGVSGASTAYTVRMNTLPTDTAGNSTSATSSLGALKGNSTAVTKTGWVGLGDTSDYYSFTLGGTSTVAVALSGLTGYADLALLNSSGSVVASSANGTTTSESLSKSLSAGTYYLRVTANTSSGGSADSSYSLKVTTTATDTAGQTTGTAKSLGTVAQATVQAKDWVSGTDKDLYKIVVSSTRTYAFRLSGLSADANLSLLSSNGSSALKASSKTGTSEEVITQSLTAGTYYLQVNPLSTSAQTYYTLSVSGLGTDRGAASYTAAASQSTSKLGALSSTSATPVTDWVGASDTTDVFQFTVSRSGSVSVSLSQLASGASVAASLLSSKGSQISSSTLSTSTTSKTFSGLSAGTYYLSLVNSSSIDTTYTASLKLAS